MRELLQHEFFAEDTGFKLELLNRESLVDSQESVINFRLRITDQVFLHFCYKVSSFFKTTLT